MTPLKILVVDDDALSRDLLVLLLAREGHTAEIAESGEAAIAALKQAAMPGLILVDLQMPGIRGSALAYRLREACHETARLLAMSASPPPEGSLEGFDGFLRKPFSMDALSAALMEPSTKDREDIESPQKAHVLDHEIYRKLEAAMSREKLAQLYALCLDDVKRRVSTMREAAARNDDESYRRAAHAIKGGCGLVGALELQTIAASGENTGITANHVATLDEFPLACERLERMLVANRQDLESKAEPARSHA
jgi:CheY-like chemotaxis protein/HPt (histidine-containing phosphotransfer) domain-containing protein